jgi:hypothetical protein
MQANRPQERSKSFGAALCALRESKGDKLHSGPSRVAPGMAITLQEMSSPEVH